MYHLKQKGKMVPHHRHHYGRRIHHPNCALHLEFFLNLSLVCSLELFC
uniref:Uncharacterized protein n=1 Tax=Arundo donax TaxID=35708 RepID=A0A0A9DWE2_ARUDO